MAGITVGAYGKLNAELSGQIELVGSSKGLEMNGEIAGEATGEAGVFASANILWVTVTKQVPVVEGTLGEFKGTKEGVPFNMSGLKELANLSSYDFSKMKEMDPKQQPRQKMITKKVYQLKSKLI